MKPSNQSGTQPLLEIKDLQTHFFTERGVAKAVDGVSFSINQGETLCVVGESGCGKSMTALSILRLVPGPGRIVCGQITFDGRDVLALSKEEMRQIRGNKISMIFQEPMSSLNPVFTVGNQIGEAIILHQKVSKAEARNRTIEMLRKVQIAQAETRVDYYPHQLSGGMLQRVMIAMALACNPRLLIADEPTTALDVTVQAQILELIAQLKAEFNMAVMMITHNLGIVAEVADHVAVMYAGKVVEHGKTADIFDHPSHPYTLGLFNSLPDISRRGQKLAIIGGNVPSPLEFPSGCRFHPRCPFVDARCRSELPPLVDGAPGHASACWFASEVREGRKTWPKN
jgi:peptide/nickel transport system ATP-binding protein/oligopeptide transport system ATP-binding protein